jgi:hypothetical protein
MTAETDIRLPAWAISLLASLLLAGAGALTWTVAAVSGLRGELASGLAVVRASSEVNAVEIRALKEAKSVERAAVQAALQDVRTELRALRKLLEERR